LFFFSKFKKSKNKLNQQQPTNKSNKSANPAAASSSFSLFNFITRKNKDSNSAATNTATSSSSNAANQQQKQQRDQKQQKNDLKIISQYIKSFETIVIRCLRQYAVTTSINLQCRILELLNQLIFLKVDYSLLDSDKIFIDFVRNQFDMLEKKTSTLQKVVNIDTNSQTHFNVNDYNNNNETGANILLNSYAIDLYDGFECEWSINNSLDPLDLDTQLNKLCASLNSSKSSSIGAYSTSRSGSGGGSSYGSSGYGASMSSGTNISSHGSASSASPITASNLHLKQQEHQRYFTLIPKMFDFFVLLTNEKKTSSLTNRTNKSSSTTNTNNNSNGLFSIPEVIQLCDNLIASENSPNSHAIPALRPLCLELFINRSNEALTSNRELEMQYDVVMISMLRLVHYPQVWPLLSIAALRYRKESLKLNRMANISNRSGGGGVSGGGGFNTVAEKWKRVSRQICDALFDAMRSQHGIRFDEYNGDEMRAVHRYSRLHVPHIQSLKQLFQLFNCLAPQVYRPIDFILLSLFDNCRSLSASIRTNQLSTKDLNNILSILIVHLHLLIVHSNERQILIRLHHLIPQLQTSDNLYKKKAKETMKMKQQQKQQRINSEMSSACSDCDENNGNISLQFTDDEDGESATFTDNIQQPSSFDYKNFSDLKKDDNSDEKNNNQYENDDDDDLINDDFDLSSPAVFFSRFLLDIIDKTFFHLNRFIKFNSNSTFSTNLSASAASATTPLTFDVNLMCELNCTQHLLSNNLLFLMYMLNSGSYSKLSNAISLLINDKNHSKKKRPFTNKEKENKINNDSSYYYDCLTVRINRIVLFKLSKTLPMISSMWQYFLLLCNYQESDYWLASFEDEWSSFANNNNNSNNKKLRRFSADLDQQQQTSMIFNEIDAETSTSIKKHQDDVLNVTLTSPYRHSISISSSNNDNNDTKTATNECLIQLYSDKREPQLCVEEQLFREVSLIIYSECLTCNQLDNTTGLTSLLINNIIDLFELVTHESIIIDLFSTIHRNAAASSLFIHSINSNWTLIIGTKRLYILQACLKYLEGVHLSASGHLLNLLIDKFFHLPYISLVRHADYIACQRVEMMQSMAPEQIFQNILQEDHINNLNLFFSQQFKYSFRHQRLISLLSELKQMLNDFNNSNQPHLSIQGNFLSLYSIRDHKFYVLIINEIQIENYLNLINIEKLEENLSFSSNINSKLRINFKIYLFYRF
jgi:uncharacterized membrane protein YgcG